MDIFAKFSLDREEGKTESTDNVESALQSMLEDEVADVDVEDSVYTVTSVDIVPNPRKRGATPKVDLGPALLRLADSYFKARPTALNFGDPVSAAKAEARRNGIEALGPEEVELDNAIFHLLMEAGDEISKAQQAAYKARTR
jgi:hypothetical protein